MDENWVCKPYDHQWEYYNRTRSLPAWCDFSDQGVGKSAIAIATTAHLWRQGEIEALVVLAPRGVEVNWALDELPTHMPRDIPWRAAIWNTSKRHTKAHQRMIKEMLAFDGLRVLCISYHGIMVSDGAKLVRRMFDKLRCMYVADESSAFKTPDTKTTKRVIASSRHAPYRRVLNGTPVHENPFHAYTQVKFADPNVWERRGISNYGQFKTFFGVWEKRKRRDNGREFPALLAYRNMPILKECLYEIGHRVLKEEVLDLPEKVYSRVYFDLTSAQRRVYDSLKDDLWVELGDGYEVSGALAITRMIRFAQITSGFVPADDEDELVWIGDKNPRMDAIETALDTITDPAILWMKYTKEIDVAAERLRNRGARFCVYDGRTSQERRQAYKRGFQAGEYDVFLAKASAAGRGLTLTAAKTEVFGSSTFSADERQQAEDRAHRIGQDKRVRIIDIVARDAVDEHILETIRDKNARSAILMGDTLRSWL